MELLNQIEEYWTKRAKGYSQVNQGELATQQRQIWLENLREHLPDKKPEEEAGRGKDPGYRHRPGFFRYYPGPGRLSGDSSGLYRGNAERSPA